MKRSLKSNLIRIYAFCGAALALALVAGSPFIAAGMALAQEKTEPQQPDQNQSPAATFAGTVVKDGEQYDLRDSSGETFKLDASAQAKPYAGKTVKVTGQLDVKAKVIHIETIESVEG